MICYISDLNLDQAKKESLQAQHEYYFNDLIGRNGFEQQEGYIVPTQEGKDYLVSQNKELGKIYGLAEEPIDGKAVKVVSVNVLNLNKDYEPKAVHDHLLDIMIGGKPEYKDLASIFQDYNFSKDVRIVNRLDKLEDEPNYFGKITKDEILIDEDYIKEEAIKNGLNPTDEFHKTLLHEITHHIVDSNLETNKKLNDQLFELKEIADKIAYDTNQPFTNPFFNVNEFVVEAFTNTEFQKFLKTIPYEKGEQTVWNKFIEIFNLFFKKLGLTNYSVLDEVLSLSNEMFKQKKEIGTNQTVSPQAQQSIDYIFENKEVISITEALDKIISGNSPLKLLAVKLKENLTDTDIEVALRDLPYHTRGEWFNGDKRIVINKTFPNPKGIEATITHEILHVITDLKLHGIENQDIKERLEKIYNKARTVLPNEYNTTNIDEFITGVFTNAEFINKVKSIPAIDVKYTNLFTELWDLFLGLFGIKEGSLYEQAFSVASEMIESGKEVQEKTPLEYYQQDLKFSPQQLSISLYKEYMAKLMDKNFEEGADIEILNELLGQGDIEFVPVYTRPIDDDKSPNSAVGLYYKKEEIPMFRMIKSSGDGLERTTQALLDDYKGVYGKEYDPNETNESQEKVNTDLETITPIDYTDKFIISGESSMDRYDSELPITGSISEISNMESTEYDTTSDFDYGEENQEGDKTRNDDTTILQVEDSITIPQSNEEIIQTLKNRLAENYPEFNLEILDKLNPLGMVDFSDKIIYLRKGRETALSEEFSHIFLALSPDKNKFISLVEGTNLYQQVFMEYSKQPSYWKDGKLRIDLIKEEAAAKLIAEAIYAQNTGDYSKFDEWITERSKKGFLKTLKDLVQKLIRFIKQESKFEIFHTAAKGILNNEIARNEKLPTYYEDLQMQQVDQRLIDDTFDTLTALYNKQKYSEEKGKQLITQMEQAYNILRDNLNTIVKTNYSGFVLPTENQQRIILLLEKLNAEEGLTKEIAQNFITTVDGVSSFTDFLIDRLKTTRNLPTDQRPTVEEVGKINRFVSQWQNYFTNLKKSFEKENNEGFVGNLDTYMKDVTNKLRDLEELVEKDLLGITTNILEGVIVPAMSEESTKYKAKLQARNSNWDDELISWLKEESESFNSNFEKAIEKWNKIAQNPSNSFEEKIASVGVILKPVYKREIKSLMDTFYTTERIAAIVTGKEVEASTLSNMFYGAATSRDAVVASVQLLVNTAKIKAATIAKETVEEYMKPLYPLIEQTGLNTVKIGEKITTVTQRSYMGKVKTTRAYLTEEKQEYYVALEEEKNKLKGLKKGSDEYKAAKEKFDRWVFQNSEPLYKDKFYTILHNDPNYVNKMLDPDYVENLTDEEQQNKRFRERMDTESTEIWSQVAAIEEKMHLEPYMINGQKNQLLEDYENEIETLIIQYNNLYSKYKDGALKSEEDQAFAEYLRNINGKHELYIFQERPNAFKIAFTKYLENYIKVIRPVRDKPDFTEWELDWTKAILNEVNKETKDLGKIMELADTLNEYMIDTFGIKSDVKKWIDKNIKKKYTDSFYEQRSQIFAELDIVNEQLAAYSKSPDVTQHWSEIQGNVKEFRDINKVINGKNVNPAVRASVLRLEKEIEELREQKQITGKYVDFADLLKERSRLNKKKAELQERVFTTYYKQALREQGISKPQEFLDALQQLTTKGIENFDNFKQIVNEFEPNNAEELHKWFIENHYRQATWFNGEEIKVWTPSYIWVEIRPKEMEHVTFEVDKKFNKKIVKPDYVKDGNKDDFGRLKPLIFDRQGKKTKWFNEEYFALKGSSNPQDRALFKILEELKQRHVEAQFQDGEFKNLNHLYYFIPQINKEFYEDPTNSIKSTYNLITGQTPNEDGVNFIQDVSDPTLGETQKDIEGNTFTNLLGKAFKTDKVKVSTDFQGNRIYRPALKYYNHIDIDQLSTDIFWNQAEFIQESNIHQAFVEMIPKFTIMDRAIKKFRMNEMRSQAYENILDREVQGINKLYEAGVVMDRGLQGLKWISNKRSQTFFNLKGALKNYLAAKGNLFINSTLFSEDDFSKAEGRWMRKYINIKNQIVNVTEKDNDFRIFEFFYPRIGGAFKWYLSDKKYQVIKKGEFWSLGTEEGELQAVGISIELFLEREYKGKKLRDQLEVVNGRLQLIDGTWDELIALRNSFDEKMRLVQGNQGVQKAKTEINRYTFGGALMFYRNYIPTMLINRFSTKRKNFAMQEEMEGYYVSTGKVIYELAQDLKNIKENWAEYSEMEKRNVMKVAKELLIMMSIILLLYLLGYSDNDKDRFKKMKDNNYFHNLMIYESLTAYQEVIGLSPLRGFGFFKEASSNFKQTSLAYAELGKVLTLASDFGLAIIGSDRALVQKKSAFADKGDLKFIEDFNKLIGINNLQATGDNEKLQEQIKNFVLLMERS